MSVWPASKARKVFAAVKRTGWAVKVEKGSSHLQLVHPIYGEATWAFHESDEIGPKMLARIAKTYKITPEDL